MTEEKKNQDLPEDNDTVKTEETSAGEGVPPDNKTASAQENEEKDKKEKKSDVKKLKNELEETKKALEEAKKSAAELNDKYLRLAAEYDNFRKRSQTERKSIYSDAIADALSGLLPIIDNLRYAAQYSGGDTEKVAAGVDMILSKLPDTLDKLGITSFGEPGEKFDPALHNAVMHVEDESLGEGEITDVLQTGYKYGDRVIRYAIVKVAN